MAKHLESLEGFPVMNEYNNFVEKMEIIEKRVIEFFTLRSQRTSSIYDDLETTANEMIKKIHTFLEPKNLLDAVLALNKYSDKVFINLYHTFRNHLIFLTVSMTTNVLSEDPAALNNVTFFKEHRDGVEIEHLSGIQSLKMANARRDQEGFKFDNLFTDAQIKSISRYSNLPQSELQNLFVFNGTTEDFEPKYTFVTIRKCNTETSHLEVFNGSTAFKATNVNNCNEFGICSRRKHQWTEEVADFRHVGPQSGPEAESSD